MRTLPAVFAILGETLRHDVFECGRRQRLQLRHRHWFAADDRRDQARARLAIECTAAGRHLIEDASEGEDVRTRIGIDPFELFGRHVLERSDDRSFLGERFVLRRFFRDGRADRHGSRGAAGGQSEVE